MSITQGAFLTHQMLQKPYIFPLPYAVEKSQPQFIENPRYYRLVYRIIGLVSQFGVALLLTVVVLRLGWLFSHWKSFTLNHIEHGILYVLTWCLIHVYFAFSYIVIVKSKRCQYAINQCVKVSPGKSNNEVMDKLLQVFVYSLVPFFCCMILGAMIMPWGIDFDPVQLVLGTSVYAKIVSSLYFLFLTLHPAIYISSAFLLILSFLENSIKFSNLLHPNVSQVSGFSNQRTGRNILYFQKRYRCILILRILVDLGTDVTEVALSLLIFVGVILATCAGYATIKLYKYFPFLFYLIMPSINFVAFCVAILFTHMASIPRRNCLRFRCIWRTFGMKKIVSMDLRAIPDVGFKVGPYGLATRKLGVMICDDIIRNTVTVLLLNSVGSAYQD